VEFNAQTEEPLQSLGGMTGEIQTEVGIIELFQVRAEFAYVLLMGQGIIVNTLGLLD